MAQGKGSNLQGNKLDSMLGSLQSDLNKLGVQTVAKGTCGACCKPIIGQVRAPLLNKSTHVQSHDMKLVYI